MAPMDCVDYDGPASGLANRMSTRCGLPVKKLGARPGSLGSYAGVDRRIATVTVELPGDASRWGTSWERIGPALLEAMKNGRGDRLLTDGSSQVDESCNWRGLKAK